MAAVELGQVGIALSVSADGGHAQRAAEAERLGYSAVWVLGGQLSSLEPLAEMVRATRRVAVAPAIIPLDVYGADEVVALRCAVEVEQPGRLMLGLGSRTLSANREFLDRLDACGVGVPGRLVAALGPRKLALARDRAAGAVTMLVTPGYVSWARDVLGPEAVLVVCELVALDSDVARARDALRVPMGFLLGDAAGYASNVRRMGFADDDVVGLSDALVDSVATGGDAEAIASSVREHLAAGADHVVLCPVVDGAEMDTARAVADRLGTAGAASVV
ncbi:LLM class F420-dependent oxidoreductase [Saccharopolyspora halophila]|uniref:LLM class F420-dependent oxidoreductase n=1 Tax=Saccharopolyspora halophila TaxID=405551 RepID=A0ABN3GI55_9PSEU